MLDCVLNGSTLTCNHGALVQVAGSAVAQCQSDSSLSGRRPLESAGLASSNGITCGRDLWRIGALSEGHCNNTGENGKWCKMHCGDS